MPPEEEGTPTEEPTAPVEGTPTVEGEPEGGTPPAVDENGETFPRSYVEELRKEAAGHRTKYKKYADAFEGYGDDEQQVLLDLARSIVEAPESASRRMIEISRQLAGDKFDDLLKDDGPKYLTEEDLLRREQQTAAQRQQEADIQAVQNEAKELGYTDDPSDPEAKVRHAELFLRAFNFHDGDLKAADAAIKANEKRVVDEYLKAKAEGGAGFITTTGDGAAAAPPGEEPKTMADASARLRALLSAQPGESS